MAKKNIKTSASKDDPQDPQEVSSEHASAYSEESFWDKVKKYAQKIGSTGLYYALVLYYMSRDEQVPFAQKAIIIGALGYLIFPIDVIPDALIGIGYGDDIAVMWRALQAVKDSVTEAHLKQAGETLKEWFPSVELPSSDFLNERS